MIIPTTIKLTSNGYARDYSTLEEDGEVILNVGLPSWGEMYTGNDLNISYWYLNRKFDLANHMSMAGSHGIGHMYIVSSQEIAIRPVVVLSKNVYITSGNGTSNNPYSLDI